MKIHLRKMRKQNVAKGHLRLTTCGYWVKKQSVRVAPTAFKKEKDVCPYCAAWLSHLEAGFAMEV